MAINSQIDALINQYDITIYYLQVEPGMAGQTTMTLLSTFWWHHAAYTDVPGELVPTIYDTI